MTQLNKCSYCDYNKADDMCISKSGDKYCEDCFSLICKKCNNKITHECWGCRKVFICCYCDDYEMTDNSWDCETYRCRRCRSLTLKELYNYFAEKYKETLTLSEIRNIILC